MPREYISCEIREQTYSITLNRPEKRNSFNAELIEELTDAYKEAANLHTIRTVVLKANGKSFSAGADLSYLEAMQSNNYEENLADSIKLKELFEVIYFHPKLTIAQVEGNAIAGGCGLATVCDFVFAIPEAQFGYTEVKIGFLPAIVSVILKDKIGGAFARRLLLTGELHNAEFLKELGLIYAILEPKNMQDGVNTFCTKIASETSAQSIAFTKSLLANITGKSLKESFNIAAVENAKARGREDCKKGIGAFLRKEKLDWRD